MAELVLTTRTSDEDTRIWTATHPQWGPAFTLDGYLGREARQLNIPLARNGGLTPWTLTTSSSPAHDRPMLSSCETLKKKVLYRGKDGVVRRGIAHGVASVFSPPEGRGKGYAGKMMTLLGDTLQETARRNTEDAICSVLYSDIGKQFYDKAGWKPFESNHIEFPASADQSIPEDIKLLKSEDLLPLTEFDEQLLLKQLNRPDQVDDRITVALLPDIDTFQWHHAREDFTCEQLGFTMPTVRGAIYNGSSRIWAIWQRNYSADATQPEKNTFYILRFVVENPNMPQEELAKGVEGVLAVARKEAAEWWCGKVQMWNPDHKVRMIVESLDGFQATYVQRESDSITSLNWFAEGSVDDVEWIANEKFAWC